MFGRSTRRTVNDNNIGMPMNFKLFIRPPEPTLPKPEPTPDPTQKKLMVWGEPTWFFLHTIAQKVKDESFNNIRLDLLKHIYNVCCNLPCPTCSQHAKRYLDSINFNAINTKEQLKQMLYVFHNSVNARKSVPMFPVEQLDEKYSLAITSKIFNNFIVHFNDTYRSPGMIADDLYRKQLSKGLIEWFRNNSAHFN